MPVGFLRFHPGVSHFQICWRQGGVYRRAVRHSRHSPECQLILLGVMLQSHRVLEKKPTQQERERERERERKKNKQINLVENNSIQQGLSFSGGKRQSEVVFNIFPLVLLLMLRYATYHCHAGAIPTSKAVSSEEKCGFCACWITAFRAKSDFRNFDGPHRSTFFLTKDLG